ncbi:MAG TPA: RNA polymerase sigma factor [Halothiobacillus sp.]|jgi:RNA polymerase sigma-70 factor (ECF subfamily)|nr:RNA polymerase sigma factor [Halothiobacillus sp.]
MNLDAEIEACIPRLRRYARVLLGGQHASADDLVQDTLERAWRKIHFWRWGSDLRPWLFGIMHNLHVDQCRRGQIPTQSLDDLDFEASVAPSQDDMLIARNLQDALRHLPREQRTVVLLVAVEQLSYQDVARSLDIPLGTVMSRLSRGRARLRELMDDCPQTSGQTSGPISGPISGQTSPVAISMKIIK